MITRHYPESKIPYLRWQVGHMEQRQAIAPLFIGRVVVGTKVTDEKVQIFRMMGWGATEREAISMMQKYEKNV